MSSGHWTNGSGDRDINNNSNWSGATAPAAGEEGRFISDFSGDGTGPNADMAALTAVDLGLLYVGDRYTEDIGGSGNDFQVSAAHVWNRGSGKLWLKNGTATIDLVTVDSSNASPTASVMNITGTVGILQMLRGGVTVDGSGTATNVVVGTRTSPQADANLTLTAGTTVVDYRQYAGTTESHKALTTAMICGGTLTQDTATIDTLWVFGGLVNFNFAGTIGKVYHYGGTIDVTQAGGAKTFTDYWKAPGAVLIGENSGLLTFTNTPLDVSNQ